MIDTHSPLFSLCARRQVAFLLLVLCGWMGGAPSRLAAAESNAVPRFNVTTYVVEGNPSISTNVLTPILSTHTGTNVSLDELVKAASEVQLEYRHQGYPAMSIAFAREQITNGIVTLNVFPTAFPQIVVSGIRYLGSTNRPEAVPTNSPAVVAAVTTNDIAPAVKLPTTPASPEQMAAARAAWFQTVAELEAQEKDTRVHVVSTNPGPRFEVAKYFITGNTVLSPAAMAGVLTNIDGAFGTNVSFDGIRTVVTELRKAYHDRGYVTVDVGLPQQKLTNAQVKLQVTEGRLANINVTGNRYFSSNNVMRAMPSLHTNTLLNGLIFQAELNRANANQDRQIYPVIGPGPEPGTSDLTLKVKDQLPLHAKVDLDNQNSPGTPDLRVNSSAVYNNLWQLENALGVQYSFSPEQYKQGKQWNFYDDPLVANYSGFYRLPLASPEPIENIIAIKPGSFGYDEATRKFNLPPPSGQPDLTFFASRSTIDTGLTTSDNQVIYDVPGVRQVVRFNAQEDLTVNSDLGARLSVPLQTEPDFQSVFSGGLDYKAYKVNSYKTNLFQFTEITIDAHNNPLPPIISTVASAVPATAKNIEYLPLSFRYDLVSRGPSSTTTFGLGLSVNSWYSSLTSISGTTTNGTATNTFFHGVQSVTNITGSTKSSGYWVVLNPSFSQQLQPFTNCPMTFRLDGQWASEPLISNEQFGAGGVNSVRGYHEGEVFGDCGWHLSLEQQTPPHLVGIAYGNAPLTIRGSVYMDYAKTYLLDPQGRPNNIALWGTGFGLTASVGSHWETRFLFSVPLISTSITQRNLPYFNFALTAQF